MSAFEFTFSLFGLLLGFSLVEVLAGLVRSIKLVSKVRVGWLTPLLGTFVMMDLTSFWSVAWQMRDKIPANFAVFLVGLAITGLYYFSASLVFPEKPEEWPDFDDWVAKHKYQVMGGILACNVITTFAVRAIVPMPLTFARVWTDVLLLTMMAVATFARPKWLTGAMLAGMIGFYLWFASVIVMSPGAFLVVSAS
jgi:hypothetical protein